MSKKGGGEKRSRLNPSLCSLFFALLPSFVSFRLVLFSHSLFSPSPPPSCSPVPTSPQFFAHPRPMRAPSLARFFARLFGRKRNGCYQLMKLQCLLLSVISISITKIGSCIAAMKNRIFFSPEVLPTPPIRFNSLPPNVSKSRWRHWILRVGAPSKMQWRDSGKKIFRSILGLWMLLDLKINQRSEFSLVWMCGLWNPTMCFHSRQGIFASTDFTSPFRSVSCSVHFSRISSEWRSKSSLYDGNVKCKRTRWVFDCSKVVVVLRNWFFTL